MIIKAVQIENGVSIHATLAGGDGMSAINIPVKHVSIHATLAGGDLTSTKQMYRQRVSIHATLAGGDSLQIFGQTILILFLSTPPSRVATP